MVLPHIASSPVRSSFGRAAWVQEMVVGDRFISVICFVPKGQENSPDVERIFKVDFALTKA